MKDINRKILCHNTQDGKNDADGDTAAAYRRLMGQVVCPQEVCEAALTSCTKQQGAGKSTALLRRPQYVVAVMCSMAVLCLLGGILFAEQIGYALGRDHRQGYIRDEVEYEGLDFTSTFVTFSRWNQKVVMGEQHQEGQYEGCYEDLRQLKLLEVLLPQYQVERYRQEQKEICDEPGYKALSYIYQDGDSRIGMNICYAPQTSAQSTVGMPDSYEMIRVNGIEYDVQYFSQKADYEEYVQMRQYSSKGDGDGQLLSREEYEEAFFWPVQIECMVNRVYYCFQLTKDIDVQEFLESIHIPTPDGDPAQTQAAGPTAGPDNKEEEMHNTGRSGTAYEYTEVEFEGLELTSCYMDRDYAEQQLELNTQQPENQYVGAYEGLKELNLLKVLLPHYQVENYSLSASGNREIQFDREWYGIYEDGDSRISINLMELGQVMATKSTDRLSGHERRTVNGVDYEILYHEGPVSYEEYLLMQQYRVAHSYEAWSCSRIEYEESYFYYPVEIICVVNGMKYEFMISGDVDLEEFLESIY
ncbi:MAG: hypothetical protein K2O34_00205 [Acetatifactor sp.]|nr:hypothetical protein [Acetatifactor sp.]